MMRLFRAILVLGLALISTGLSIGSGSGGAETPINPGRELIDHIWVWGIPIGNGVGNMPKGRMLATTNPAHYAQANPQSRAAILGVRNVVMAGDGLPNNSEKAEELSKGIAGLKRIVWELTPDNGEGPPFVYTDKLKILKKLDAQYPQIEAVSIDDMLTAERKRGLRLKHLVTLRRQLRSQLPGLRMWGIVYTMNLRDPALSKYLKVLDVVNLWTWKADKIPNLDRHVATMEKLAHGKPIVLGLYMYDYGGKRKMPRDLMEMQCRKALALAEQGRIRGIVFLSINNDPGTITWVRDWIKKVRNTPIG